MMRGTVIRYFSDRGFGFVRDDDSGEDFFVHVSQAHAAGILDLHEKQRLEFLVEVDAKTGRQRAVDLKEMR